MDIDFLVLCVLLYGVVPTDCVVAKVTLVRFGVVCCGGRFLFTP
jgi:hypothetical protein